MPSSVIGAFSDEPEAHRLDIIFEGGRRQSYADVPPKVFEGMKRAFSKDSFLSRQVRDRYPASRVS